MALKPLAAILSGAKSLARELAPGRLVAFVAAAIAFIFIGAMVVSAAELAAVPPTAGTFVGALTNTWDAVEGIGILIFCVLALFSGGRLVVLFINILGIKDATQKAQLEKLFNDRLHSAIANAIQFAVTRSGLPISAITVETVLSDAVAYLQDKNPDTIAFFNLEAKQLEDLVAANWPNVFGWLKSSEAAAPQAGNTSLPDPVNAAGAASAPAAT